MAAPSAGFTLDHGRIRLDDAVFVYLERTLAREDPLPADVGPRAYGISPIAISPNGSVVAAVGPGEAVWLGFQPVDAARPAIVRVRIDRDEPVDAVTGGPWREMLQDEPRNYLICPPDSRLSGMRQGSGHVPFRPGELTVVSYNDDAATVSIELMNPETFARLTGIEPDALDPENAYKCWRLP